MKWFCYLFSVYVFVLTCFPCNDGEHGHVMLEQGQTTFAATPIHPADHQACNDLCSPFCSCACCGSTLQVSSVYHFSIASASILIVKRLFPYAEAMRSACLEPLFQPPRLS